MRFTVTGSKLVAKWHFNSWIPKLLRVSAITFGNHVFCRYTKSPFSPIWFQIDHFRDWFLKLVAHEHTHVHQYAKFRLFGWWWTSILPFLFIYLMQWFDAECTYSKISYEIDARNSEKRDYLYVERLDN